MISNRPPDRFDRFVLILTTLAAEHPDMTLARALDVASDIEIAWEQRELGQVSKRLGEAFKDTRKPPPSFDAETLGVWAMTQPQVMQYMPHKKIQAIKELRACSTAGLKEAKDAIEWIEAYGVF